MIRFIMGIVLEVRVNIFSETRKSRTHCLFLLLMETSFPR